jgi:YHS domain-containing protein
MLSYDSIYSKIIHSAFSVTALIIACSLFSCTGKPKTEANGAITSDPLATKTETPGRKFTSAMVDNKKDPNCGMPVSAGIADTVHYNGKVYGFCSDECRDAFLKNPVALAKSAETR